ncbi:MAG TPA: hypothetical protein VF781_09555, partial [Solirubrobacteraceae bacterium]
PANAREAAATNYLKLTGLPPAVAQQFMKLELKLQRQFYDKRGIDKTFLKIRTAQNTYETQQKADKRWLKITDANTNFLKITDANTNFLKIGDANAEFLKIGGIAADSNKLGGLPAGQFFQGRGNVMSNELTLSPLAPQQALLGDGSVRVLIGLLQAGQPSITLENATNVPLNFTVNGGAAQTGAIPAANADGPGRATVSPNAAQLDIQVFGSGGGAGKVWTITLSTLSGQAGQTFVGQMLIGLL